LKSSVVAIRIGAMGAISPCDLGKVWKFLDEWTNFGNVPESR